MASPQQLEQLRSFYDAAKVSGHIFPQAAACEACVESAWGTSELYVKYRNIFGQKQSSNPIFKTVSMPTREYVQGKLVEVNADWVIFPTAAEAFEGRMSLLMRLANTFPAYNRALHATTPEDFLVDVSKAWSTDKQRANKCIEILHAHSDILANLPPVETT